MARREAVGLAGAELVSAPFINYQENPVMGPFAQDAWFVASGE